MQQDTFISWADWHKKQFSQGPSRNHVSHQKWSQWLCLYLHSERMWETLEPSQLSNSWWDDEQTCLFLLEQVSHLLLCGIWHWFGTVIDNLPSSLSGDLAFLDKGTSDRMGAIAWIYKFTVWCLFTYLLLTPTVNARSFLPGLAVLKLSSTERCH